MPQKSQHDQSLILCVEEFANNVASVSTLSTSCNVDQFGILLLLCAAVKHAPATQKGLLQ